MGHHIHGIGGDDEGGIRGCRQDRGYDFAKHLGVSLKQLQPSFAGLLSNALADDDNTATL